MTQTLDFRGLRCPQPVLKAALAITSIAAGTTVEIKADCPEFPSQVKEWCGKTGRVLINVVSNGKEHTATIRV